MAVKSAQSSAKRERTIPVKVNVDPRPAPTTLPPAAEADLRPKPTPVKPIIKAARQVAAPIRAVRQPVHEWPEARRRKLMWWLVGGGMAVIVIGWLALVRLELSGGNGPNIFLEAKKLFTNLRWPGTGSSDAAEQEIRQLDNQVFPQFQK